MPDFSQIRGFRCVTCNREYAVSEAPLTCVACGPLAGTLDILYDLEHVRGALQPDHLRAREDTSIWRYHELLPIRIPEARVPLAIGPTPLERLECDLGFTAPSRLYVKDDTRHPSGSTKDRATAVGIAHAREVGAAAVAAASTGNAASSLAMFAARATLPCYIFVPADAPTAKLAQIQVHGATLFAIQGSYDEAFDLCMTVCERLGYYNRNTAVNPFLGEGKKTLALEVWEQLGYLAPEVVVLPVGDGCILGGVHKGFADLRDAGLATRVPRLIGVQAAASAALAEAWRAGRARCEPVTPQTVADSIAVAMPRDQVKGLRAIRESGGAFVTVTDDEILAAQAALAQRAGLFVEPAAAAAMAGLRAALSYGVVMHDDEVVVALTGHGLKDVAAAQRIAAANPPITIEPSLDEVLRALEEG